MAEIVAQGVVRNLSQRPGQFHPRGAAAHDHERQPLVAPLGIGLALGVLESRQHAPADLGGVLDGFQTGRQRVPFVMAEIRVGGAAGYDQVVVGNGPVLEDHAPPGDIEIHRFGQQHLGVAVTAKHGTQRRGNFTGRKPARGDLVQQGLKQVKVAPVHQGQFHRRLP